MKKILISSLIIIIAYMLFIVNVSNAADLQATLRITSDKGSTSIEEGDYITFTFKITDIANAAQNSVTAAGGVITYNTNFFETVDEEDCTGIVINPSNGSFNCVFSASEDKEIGTIKLKVKANPIGSGTVSFSELSASDGESMVNTNNINFTFSVPNNSPITNQVANETTNQTVNNENNILNINKNNIEESNNIEKNNIVDKTIAGTILPKTGGGYAILIITIIAIIVAIRMYKKYTEYRAIK